MAANSQTVCYPSQANANGQKPVPADTKPMCTKCNAKNPHTKKSCCTSRRGNNSTEMEDPCDKYCDSSCNTVCDTVQAYCSISHQLINSHSDVGAHPPIACTAKDEFIFKNWTKKYWDALSDKLDTAEIVGYTEKQGQTTELQHVAADPTNVPHPVGSLITAKIYNTLITKMNRFHRNIATVKGVSDNGIGDVIRGAHALGLVSNYNAATFNDSVCDQCNAEGQTNPTCDCNCSCSCSCNCGCGCSCPCSSSGRS